MAYRDDPTIKYGLTTLQQMGGQESQLGPQTTQQATGMLGPVTDYYSKLLSGDPNALMQAISPEADVVGQQFGQIRQMISQQPRGGGKTAQLAQLPVEQTRILSGLLGQARNAAPQGLQSIAGLLAQLGLGESQQGIQSAEGVAQIGLQGRQQDISSSWTNFFKSLATMGAQGAGQGLGYGIMK